MSRRSDQAVADAAHRLQEQRIGRVALDLAAQAVDLHVDRALIGGRPAGEPLARHGARRRRREHAQDVALAIGQMDGLLALAQFAAGEMEDEGAEADLFPGLRRRRARVRLRILPMRSISSRGSNGLAT